MNTRHIIGALMILAALLHEAIRARRKVNKRRRTCAICDKEFIPQDTDYWICDECKEHY